MPPHHAAADPLLAVIRLRGPIRPSASLSIAQLTRSIGVDCAIDTTREVAS
jgi:hypothetical protein